MQKSPSETRGSLILRLQNSDDVAAWDEFVELYGPIVFRVARRRGMQVADAENLIQEVLMAVAQSVNQWLERTDRGSFRAWLLRIAHNETVDMVTARSTRKLGWDGEQGQRILEEVALRDDLSSFIELEYERAVFQWAADRVQQEVAQHTWQAFWLTEVEGMSVNDAAQMLGTRRGNIYFGRSRVMARIKELARQYEVQK